MHDVVTKRKLKQSSLILVLRIGIDFEYSYDENVIYIMKIEKFKKLRIGGMHVEKSVRVFFIIFSAKIGTYIWMIFLSKRKKNHRTFFSYTLTRNFFFFYFSKFLLYYIFFS